MSTRLCCKERQVFLAHTEDKSGAQQQRSLQHRGRRWVEVYLKVTASTRRRKRQTIKGTTTQNNYQKAGWGRILQANRWRGRRTRRGHDQGTKAWAGFQEQSRGLQTAGSSSEAEEAVHVVNFNEEEVSKDAAQNGMCKAGLQKAQVHWREALHQQLLTASWAMRGRRDLQRVPGGSNLTGDGLVLFFFQAGRHWNELMLLAQPEEQKVRVDTKRGDEKVVKWLRWHMTSRANGGVSKRRQAKNFCLCWRMEGF